MSNQSGINPFLELILVLARNKLPSLSQLIYLRRETGSKFTNVTIWYSSFTYVLNIFGDFILLLFRPNPNYFIRSLKLVSSSSTTSYSFFDPLFISGNFKVRKATAKFLAVKIVMIIKLIHHFLHLCHKWVE